MKRRAGYTLVEVTIAMAVLAMLALMARVSFAGSKAGAYRRSCHKQQRVIAGALEAYNIDYSLSASELTTRLVKTLVREGYLRGFPQDPGHEGQGELAYRLERGVIRCKHHGSVFEDES